MGNRAEQPERERESNVLRESERTIVGEEWFYRGSKMAVSEMEHLSIFINRNQKDKQLSIKIRVGHKFFN
jgi:hypothetical protein